MQLGIELLQPLQINVGEPLRGELASLDPARELRHRCERNVFVSRGQRPGIDLAAHKPLALWPRLLPRQHRIPPRRRSDRRSRSQPCAARSAARRPPPSSCANCPPQRRAQPRSSRTAPAFRPRRTSSTDTSGPTAGPAPNAGGAPGGTIGRILSRRILPWPRSAAAAPSTPSDVKAMNCLRDFPMNPPQGIVAATENQFVSGSKESDAAVRTAVERRPARAPADRSPPDSQRGHNAVKSTGLM